MTDQSTIFGQEAAAQQPATTPANTDQVGNSAQGKAESAAAFMERLAAIKNDEGIQKYSSVEDALDALSASQEHIKRLERENADFRGKEIKAHTTEEILSLLNSSKKDEGDNQNQIDMEQIKGLIQQTVSERESAIRAKENQKLVSSALTAMYGEKAEEIYLSKARELGIDVGSMDSLASASPKAVLAYFNTKSGNVGQNVNGTVNTETFVTPKEATNPNIMFGASKTQVMDLWREIASSVNQGN